MCLYSADIMSCRKEDSLGILDRELMACGGQDTRGVPQKHQDHVNGFERDLSGGKNVILRYGEMSMLIVGGLVCVCVCV